MLCERTCRHLICAGGDIGCDRGYARPEILRWAVPLHAVRTPRGQRGGH